LYTQKQGEKRDNSNNTKKSRAQRAEGGIEPLGR